MHSQADWNEWAKTLARETFTTMFASRVKGLADATAQVLKAELTKRDDRIALLERRLGELEKAVTKDSSSDEWPIPQRNAA